MFLILAHRPHVGCCRSHRIFRSRQGLLGCFVNLRSRRTSEGYNKTTEKGLFAYSHAKRFMAAFAEPDTPSPGSPTEDMVELGLSGLRGLRMLNFGSKLKGSNQESCTQIKRRSEGFNGHQRQSVRGTQLGIRTPTFAGQPVVGGLHCI